MDEAAAQNMTPIPPVASGDEASRQDVPLETLPLSKEEEAIAKHALLEDRKNQSVPPEEIRQVITPEKSTVPPGLSPESSAKWEAMREGRSQPVSPAGEPRPFAASGAERPSLFGVSGGGGPAQSSATAQGVCPKCHMTVRPTDYFCFNCGQDLKPKPPDTSLTKQALIYIGSIVAPPMGIIWGMRYLRQPGRKAKMVGWIAIILTVVELYIATIASIQFMNTLREKVDSQMQNIQGY